VRTFYPSSVTVLPLSPSPFRATVDFTITVPRSYDPAGQLPGVGERCLLHHSPSTREIDCLVSKRNRQRSIRKDHEDVSYEGIVYGIKSLLINPTQTVIFPTPFEDQDTEQLLIETDLETE